PFILVALFLVSVLHTLAGVSRPYTNLILATLQVVLFGTMTWQNPLAQKMLSASQDALLRSIPLDIRTALSTLRLEPKVTIYATC
ncbi:hypothetical protein C8Q76DRAFT_568477, partial [Earliella scabrosa]